MCGFLFNFNKDGVDPSTFISSLDLIAHRGPDDEGFAIAPTASDAAITLERQALQNFAKKPEIAFGHKRLSIVDLSTQSRQPCVSHDNKSALLFNGEIYNYRELASSPESRNSDTLTLFEYLNKNGINKLHKLNGMWAFCYYDANNQKLYLSRDRYGKKPAYYYMDSTQLIICSEMKSIFSLLPNLGKSRKITKEGFTYYLLGKQTPFLNNGETFYKDIKSVKPGETLVFDLKTLKCSHFAQNNFEYFDSTDFSKMSDQKFYETLKADISASIHTRLKTDVPVTILASGGVDSSWIAGLAAQNLKEYGNLSLYTCHIMDGEDNPNDDLSYARLLSKELGLELREIAVNPLQGNEFFDICTKLTRQVELPLNLFLSVVPTYLMTQDMQQRGIKVVLDGVGGDEIMGGYPSYDSLFMAAMRNKDFIRAYKYYQTWLQFMPRQTSQMVQLLKSGAKCIFFQEGINSTADHMEKIFSEFVINKNLLEHFANFSKKFSREKMSNLTDRQLFEISFYQLPYYLGVADQMSMINSIENRSPFLDARMHKYIYAPDRFKFRGGYNKYALRKTMPENISDNVRWRKGKIGIGNAYSHKLMDRPIVRECIMDSPFIRSLFDIDKLQTALECTSSRNTVRPLYSLALLDSIYGLEFENNHLSTNTKIAA